MSTPFSISVLISGGGTTLKNLIQKKSEGLLVPSISQVVSSNPKAGGIRFAREANIECHIINHKNFRDCESFSEAIFSTIRKSEADLVVMGGFLRRLKIPFDFVNRVVNIHPSLFPSFCGQGLYGSHVHQAVIDYGCRLTGCTIHFVDDHYDHGPIIAQRAVPVLQSDNTHTLAKRVFQLECILYPETINLIASNPIKMSGRRVEITYKI